MGIRNWFRGQDTPSLPFRMEIDDAFELTVPNKVVVVGVVSEGELRPGFKIILRNDANETQVTAEALEAHHRPLKVARQGDRVGVLLVGAVKDQVGEGAVLVSDAS